MPEIKQKFTLPTKIIMLVGVVLGAMLLLKRNRNNIEDIVEKIDDEADETIEKLEAAIAKAKQNRK